MDSSNHTYVAVVDDDESICRSLARLLRATGLQPVTYPSAEAFLSDQKQPRFDCLVLDIQLSGISGLELHQHLRDTGSTTPVIYNTAHDEGDFRKRANHLGCIDYLQKTENADAVLAAIQRAIEPHDVKNE